jgi:3'(2'), 5'-bisphosphate nucleotidase
VVVAEEEIATGHVAAAAAEFWSVDPLDGTREFADGRDDFAVNIGLVRGGRPVLGVVAVPATGVIYGGIVGVGAWLQSADGARVAITTRAVPDDGLTVVASRHHGDQAQLDRYLFGRTIARTVNFGSSLKFCRVAEGQADVYPRFGRTMEWDTCSPQAVLEAAGGVVLTLDGAPLRYGKPGWDNPHFVCWGRAPR